MMMLRRHGRNLRTSIQLGKMRPGSSTGGDSPSTFSIQTGDTTQFPVSAFLPSSRATASTANILDTPYWIPYHQAIQFAMHMHKLGLEEGKTEEDQTDSGEASKDDSFCDDGFRLRIEEMGQSMMRQKDSGYCGSESNN